MTINQKFDTLLKYKWNWVLILKINWILSSKELIIQNLKDKTTCSFVSYPVRWTWWTFRHSIIFSIMTFRNSPSVKTSIEHFMKTHWYIFLFKVPFYLEKMISEEQWSQIESFLKKPISAEERNYILTFLCIGALRKETF